MSELIVNDLNIFYGSAHVLQDVSLQIGAEPVALVGRNGMGKTTLCNAFFGLVPSRSGEITFSGHPLGWVMCRRDGAFFHRCRWMSI